LRLKVGKGKVLEMKSKILGDMSIKKHQYICIDAFFNVLNFIP